MSTTLDIGHEYEPQQGDEVVIALDGEERTAVLGKRNADGRWWVSPHASHTRLINPADILRPAGEIIPAANTLSAISLTADQREALRVLEGVIDTHKRAFLAVGSALAVIGAERLYLETHDTFEAYMDDRHGISAPTGYEWINAHQNREILLSAMADIPGGKELVESLNARHYRELGKGFLDIDAKVAALREAHTQHPEGFTARELAEIADEKGHDYQGREVGQVVRWVEDQTGYWREGAVDRLWRDRVHIRPTDGGGPELVSLEPDRVKDPQELPGTPNPFGNCAACDTILTGRDHCPACAEKADEIERTKADAERHATRNDHLMGPWVASGDTLRSSCPCGASATIFTSKRAPDNASFSQRLYSLCHQRGEREAGRPALLGVPPTEPEPNPRPGVTIVPAIPTAQELDGYRAMLRSMPPKSVAREYASYRDATDPAAYQWRADACRAELDRRRAAGVDAEILTYCEAHDDYKCGTCAAIARTRAMAQAGGVSPEAMVTAAGLRESTEPPAPWNAAGAPDDYNRDQAAAWQNGREAARTGGEFNPERVLSEEWITGWETLLPVPAEWQAARGETPEPEQPTVTSEPAPVFQSTLPQAAQAPEAPEPPAQLTLGKRPGAPDGAPGCMVSIPTDCRDWIASTGLTVRDYLYRLKSAAYTQGTDATAILAQLEA